MRKKVRRVFKFRYPDGKKIYCEACMPGPVIENDYESCVEIKEGKCQICEYEKGPKEVVLGKIVELENQIKEARRIIEVIEESPKEIRIDQLIFHRNADYESKFRDLSDPENIIRRLQFPIILNKEDAVRLFQRQIKRLEEKINSLSEKINNPA